MPALSGSDRALMYAQAGVQRAGASRAGYHSSKVFVAIEGTHYASAPDTESERILDGSLTINDLLDQTPNTATMAAHGFVPSVGQDVVVTLGSKNTLVREFAGTILSVDEGYVGTPANRHFNVHAIDYTYLANRRKVLSRYMSESATEIAIDIVSRFTSGFTSVNVEVGLASVDEITFTNQDVSSALNALAKRIGAYWFWDYHKDLHFFVNDPGYYTNPTDLTDAAPPLTFRVTRDGSQLTTRELVEGGGANAKATVGPNETILPVDDTARYNAGGGTVVCGPQRITYTGLRAGGRGALVGPGAAPGVAPTVAAAAGAGLAAGAFGYAFTFVTGAGESLPSPLGSVTIASGASQADPVAIGTPSITAGSPYAVGALTGTYRYKYTFKRISDGAETAPTAASGSIVCTHSILQILLSDCDTVPSGYTRQWYRTKNAGATYFLLPAAQNPTYWVESGGYLTDLTDDSFLVTAAPASNGTGGQQVTISGVAIGGSGTTARKIYRTAANGSQLKLQQTLADNVSTTAVQDASADGSLGANVPTSDTSGLTQPTGQITAGSTTLLLAGAGAFSASGGWSVIGNGQQVIRYTGISGNSLTGIPASGIGSIVATISYNSTATDAPVLLGIPSAGTGSILYTILLGDQVNLLAQVDDLGAQADAALALGGDGIHEDYVQDGRLSYTEAYARGAALLQLQRANQVTPSYTTRDRNSRSGREVTIDLPDSEVDDTFKIQQVTTTDFQPALMPLRSVLASSVRYTFEDILRQERK